MKSFMDHDFLLSNETALFLYQNVASKMPICDYHCHINPKEIAENRSFENITQVWLGGDHYKWRLMRSCGISEEYITGSAPDKEKFIKWAYCLERAIGNPLYHWSHLELKFYFGYDGLLTSETAEQVWTLCNEKLKDPELTVRNLILRSNVNVICTTDDPIDDLKWHALIKQDTSFPTKVYPAWRPDKVLNIDKDTFLPYLKKLEAVCDFPIDSYSLLKKALKSRFDYFQEAGCCVSDHALDFVMYQPYSEEKMEEIFDRVLAGEKISSSDILSYKTGLMTYFAELYTEYDWVMQLHYGCKRDNNETMFSVLGPDTGFDCIRNEAPSVQLADFLNHLSRNDCLPKTILYSLNPNDNASIDSILGCFQSEKAISKIQHGSAWWFNDHKKGMEEHLISLGNLGNLSGFIGMLTDSRSFLSYTRHDYFRRILCNLLGTWVENGEFPNDRKILTEIVENICYKNTESYFNFK